VLLIAYIKGQAPIQALEFARRAIPSRVRPGFNEMEQYCKKVAGEPAPEATQEAAPAPA
jgi:chemotaxis protein MotA